METFGWIKRQTQLSELLLTAILPFHVSVSLTNLELSYTITINRRLSLIVELNMNSNLKPHMNKLIANKIFRVSVKYD